MRYFPFLLLILKLSACSTVDVLGKKTESQMIYSSLIKDSFLLTIQKPEGYTDTGHYKLILVADGAINLGKKILNYCENNSDSCKTGFIVVTISHTGNWKMKRRRDFIPSDLSNNSTEEFGQANLYFNFIKQEVFPILKSKIPNATENIFIGHSFTGLFALYLSLKDTTLFNKYYAISPSCWANYNELLKIEQGYSIHNKSLNAHIKIYAGDLEILNKVLSSTKSFYNQVQSRKYDNLKMEIEIMHNETHLSIVDPALKKIIYEITQ
ncbi:MAG TPA: alpha/beta hydrolase-fold protein [Lacibacter sp.]|nr:alpha/beta hydrolase-fold protein [Lacibacter sp.]